LGGVLPCTEVLVVVVICLLELKTLSVDVRLVYGVSDTVGELECSGCPGSWS
jgi:hypothetical protein